MDGSGGVELVGDSFLSNVLGESEREGDIARTLGETSMGMGRERGDCLGELGLLESDVEAEDEADDGDEYGLYVVIYAGGTLHEVNRRSM